MFQLPEVQKDLCHFHPVVPQDLEALLLTSRPALAPLLDNMPQVNSDYFPVLDLGAERSRFLGRSASGINGCSTGSSTSRAHGLYTDRPRRTDSELLGTVPGLRLFSQRLSCVRGGGKRLPPTPCGMNPAMTPTTESGAGLPA